MRRLLIMALLLIAASCDNVAPTPTPERTLSAPTLAPSPIILPIIPTSDPALGINDPTAAALPSGGEFVGDETPTPS